MQLVKELCKNYMFAELYQKYEGTMGMGEWLAIEARHELLKELPKQYPTPAAFVDVSYVKTAKHLQFGRGVQEVLVMG